MTAVGNCFESSDQVIFKVLLPFFFWLHLAACGTYPTTDRTYAPSVEAQSLNYWTTREVLFFFFKSLLEYS